MSGWRCARCGYGHLSGENVRCCPFPEREASTLEPVLSVAEVLGVFTAELKIAKAWTPELQAHYDGAVETLQEQVSASRRAHEALEKLVAIYEADCDPETTVRPEWLLSALTHCHASAIIPE